MKKTVDFTGRNVPLIFFNVYAYINNKIPESSQSNFIHLLKT